MKKQELIFFVYGTLLKGLNNHYHRLDGPTVEPLGAYVTDPCYTMVSVGGGFPAVYCTGTTAIHGELYRTSDPKVIQSLYWLEGYSGTPNAEGGHNDFYDLEIIDTPHGKANMFVFRGKIRYPIIGSGNWKKRHELV